MDVFALLAEPVRFRIVEILATGEHNCTCCGTPDMAGPIAATPFLRAC